jgi:UDP-N-acetylmuramoyl-tripeptide--D-alanyl-D-alanine ligase
MNELSPASIRSALGGAWLARPVAESFGGVSTDTRTLRPGQVFFALRGERFDGHAFLHAAVVAGAGLLVVDDPDAATPEIRQNPMGCGVLRVPDTLAALARLAAGYRQTLTGAKVIAVTGSNGKTTTVRLIESILGQRLRGTASVRSFNNAVGVPLTILAARQNDQFLVCEVGMNAPGEIASLARIVDPDIAVITSIGRAHIETFGSVDAILAEKASLLGYLRPNGLAVIPADVPDLVDYAKPVPNVVRFGRAADADLRLSDVVPADDGQAIDLSINERESYRVPLPGAHNATNALAAVAVARRLGLQPEAIRAGLAAVQRPEMRFQRVDVAGVRYINDAYNASPESTRAAVETFFGLPVAEGDRRVVVLGDMLELGDHAAPAHREIGRLIRELGPPDVLAVVGSAALHVADVLVGALPESHVVICSEMDDAAARRVLDRLRPGDHVLVKGSRSMGLERLIDVARRHDRASNAGVRAPSVA